MKSFFRRYAMLALILLLTVTMLDGCRSVGPKKWWEFWKRPPRMFPVSDDTTLPGAPGVEPIEPGKVSEAAGPGHPKLLRIAMRTRLSSLNCRPFISATTVITFPVRCSGGWNRMPRG